uniref:TauD/TfdA-like domain-containing protein n=1 Tax=Bionectria ochroleuca TaxID=29856 RepID=A0A0B7JYL0_BIOOC
MRVATRRLISSYPRPAAACVAQSHRVFLRPSIGVADAVAFQPCNRFHTSGLSPNRHTSESSPQYQEDAIEKEEPAHVEVDVQPPAPRSKWRGRQLNIPRLARSLPMHVDAQNGEALQVSWHDNSLYVVDESEKGFEFQATQLRDGCQCPRCVDPSSGQKSFATSQVPTWIKIQHVEQTDVGVVVSTFGDLSHSTEDSHVITLTWEWIRNHFSRGTEPINPRMFQLQRRFGLEHWDADIISRKVRKIDYHEYMKGEGAFWDVVQDLVRLGIVFLKNVPRDENSIVEITTRMANIRETFYGRTFDVRAKPNAENVAYTSGYLGLHQDLLYLQPPPKIQIFEALVNEESAMYETKMEPGEAVFFDNMRVLHGRKARASYAPETHAQPLWARRALWNPGETEAELVATDWYTQLLDRLRRIQTESQAEEHRAVERARSRLQEQSPSFR